MENKDQPVKAAKAGITIETDVKDLHAVARKILNCLNSSDANLNPLDDKRKISLVKELATLMDILLKLQRVKKDLDLGLGDMMDSSGSVLSPAEMTLLGSFLSKAAKKPAPPNS